MVRYCEKETTIDEARRRKNLSIAELSELTGVSQSAISSLSIGLTSPVYINGPKQGDTKPWVIRVQEELGTPMDVLFPAYFCNVHTYLTVDEVRESTTGQSSFEDGMDTSTKYEHSQGCRKILEWLRGRLPTRYFQIVVGVFFEEQSYEALGERHRVSKERIRQILSLSINSLIRDRANCPW